MKKLLLNHDDENKTMRSKNNIGRTSQQNDWNNFLFLSLKKGLPTPKILVPRVFLALFQGHNSLFYKELFLYRNKEQEVSSNYLEIDIEEDCCLCTYVERIYACTCACSLIPVLSPPSIGRYHLYGGCSKRRKTQ